MKLKPIAKGRLLGTEHTQGDIVARQYPPVGPIDTVLTKEDLPGFADIVLANTDETYIPIIMKNVDVLANFINMTLKQRDRIFRYELGLINSEEIKWQRTETDAENFCRTKTKAEIAATVADYLFHNDEAVGVLISLTDEQGIYIGFQKIPDEDLVYEPYLNIRHRIHQSQAPRGTRDDD